MKDYVSFPVYDSKDINANIETLQKLLENTGIAILYEKNQDPLFEKLNLGLLQFRWDADVLQKKMKRNAGRKFKLSNYTYTLEEIQNKVKEQGADATAKELGLSRSRFYARLKKAKDSGSYYF